MREHNKTLRNTYRGKASQCLIKQWFFGYHTKSTTKEKNKLDFIKTENFCTSKNIIERVKRQLSEWEKIFANYVPAKGLLSKICKEHLQLKNKQISQFKNGQMTWTDVSPKKIYKWPKSMWKVAQHYKSSGKRKSKLLWDRMTIVNKNKKKQHYFKI